MNFQSFKPFGNVQFLVPRLVQNHENPFVAGLSVRDAVDTQAVPEVAPQQIRLQRQAVSEHLAHIFSAFSIEGQQVQVAQGGAVIDHLAHVVSVAGVEGRQFQGLQRPAALEHAAQIFVAFRVK